MSSVIQVSNLSKIYRLGEIGTGTITHDLERWYKMKIRGKEDPFLKIGETNEHNKKGESDVVFALREINFEVQRGEALGIIGKNGAGKSTLLKILSRVTSPTSGKVKIKGRIASLLEVGTGFHPELTGRENIYLNGAILGMRRKEIDRKFDEIIDFSGVERYVDTPVKRYSSGMYVRLAFSVAAHLESEILIVDEVLAVGDAEFQKKAIGKMKNIKDSGETILLVSHNITNILSLSTRCILLNNGTIIKNGNSRDVVAEYLAGQMDKAYNQTDLQNAEHYGNGYARFKSINLIAKDLDNSILLIPVNGCTLEFEIRIIAVKDILNSTVGLTFYDEFSNRIIDLNSLVKDQSLSLKANQEASVTFELKNVRLRPAIYTIGLWLGIINQYDIDGVRYATSFRFEKNRNDNFYLQHFPGFYTCEFEEKIRILSGNERLSK
jgi:lipopolysaccharide transport system ATP-binding protein